MGELLESIKMSALLDEFISHNILTDDQVFRIQNRFDRVMKAVKIMHDADMISHQATLRHAKEVIRTWHGMDHTTESGEKMAWQFYQHSPEMKLINNHLGVFKDEEE